MSLNWPWALIALVALPAIVGWWAWVRRRRRRSALRISSVALIRAAVPPRSPWRRRIPAGLFALGLVVLGVGAARPHATAVVPSDSSAILLALDVSSSMCSTDVQPNRLTAAQNAAKEFVKAQHDGTKIGLVVFSGIAAVAVPPTTDKGQLIAALDNLRTSRGTAIGLGILAAIDAIAQINPNVAATGVDLPDAAPTDAAQTSDFEPDTIVVLTDGANTQGVDPVTAAQQAAARHVRVYTIGFGTTEPAPFVCTANQIGGDAFGPGRGGNFQRGFGGGGGRNAQDIDEDTLTQVAQLTGAQYYQAKDAEELTNTLIDLPSAIALQHKKIEVTVWFALAGTLLVLAALGLTQWWNRPGPAAPPPSQ